MDEKQEVFSEFMSEFKKLDVDLKNNEIIEKEKEMLAYLIKYAELHGIKYDFLRSKEILDLNSSNINQDDYLEAMMTYLQNIEELTGLILMKNE